MAESCPDSRRLDKRGRNLSTDNRKKRRRKSNTPEQTVRSRNVKHSRSGKNNRNRSRSGGAAGNRQGTGRGMTRQQRQKQLMKHMLIAAAVIIAAILIIVGVVRAGHGGKQSAEVSQTSASAQNTVTAEAASVSSETDVLQKNSGTETAETDAAQSAASQEASAVQQAGTAGSTQETVTQADTASEEEETSGTSMAEQSLVEKLSVEAKKNLETEKARLAKEEEERERQAEEEAMKAEVKDREELSQLSIDELAEYLRNKEVPEELIDFMEEYPEAREFVTDYLYQPDPPLSKDISGEVQKGVFPHFLQWDERWGYENYGGSFFAVAGCGPTAMSVVYSGLTGKADMNPYAMSQWAEEQGYYIVGEGTSWEMMWSGANSLGLYWWEVDFDEMSIRSALQSGCPIIAAMSPGGDFTSFGHFIVMTDIDEEGNITIRDSNSIERTERTWTWDELMWQTAAMWAYNYDDGSYDEEAYY